MRGLALSCMALIVSIVGLFSMRAYSDDAICALSDEQERVALDAFHTMAPIFKEPRCVNCHGAVDPFKEGGGHLGGVFPIKMHKVRNLVTEVDEEERDFDASMKPCQDCHSLNHQWSPATNPEIAFINKSEEELCLQMKIQTPGPDKFVSHMTRDGGDFIPEAFKGTRALDENGVATYENETDKDYMLEPPKITHATLIEQARAWADAVGEKNWFSPIECGCVPQKKRIKITQHWTVNSDLLGTKAQLDSLAEFMVDLTFKEDGTFSGAKTVPREFVENVVAPGGACAGKGTWTEKWSVTGKVNPDTHELDMKVRFDSLPGKVEANCGRFGATRASRGFSSDSVTTPLYAGFSLPAKDGEKKHFEWSFAPGKNTVDIEFLKPKR